MNEPKWKLPYGFTIDAAVAETIRREIELQWEIGIINSALGFYYKTEDQRVIQRRIEEIAKTIPCPKEYNLEQYRQDHQRLRQLYMKRISPFGSLNSEEDAEDAQLSARTEVFDWTPERQAQIRADMARISAKYKLQENEKRLTADEEKEFNRVKSLCRVTPIEAGKPAVICADPSIKICLKW
jgi:hypothetical protein